MYKNSNCSIIFFSVQIKNYISHEHVRLYLGKKINAQFFMTVNIKFLNNYRPILSECFSVFLFPAKYNEEYPSKRLLPYLHDLQIYRREK